MYKDDKLRHKLPRGILLQKYTPIYFVFEHFLLEALFLISTVMRTYYIHTDGHTYCEISRGKKYVINIIMPIHFIIAGFGG